MSKNSEFVYLDWEPRAIACMRGNIRTGISYDAEVKFLDKQYLVRQGIGDRDEAMSAAQVIVDKLTGMIRAAGQEVLGGLKEAKP